jgi:dihydroorotase
MPGLDTLSRLGLLFARGGRLDLTRFAASSSFNAAKRFGLRGKGAIREGFDADIIIYDQANIFALSPLKKSELKTKCGWSAFEGALMCKPPEKFKSEENSRRAAESL